MRSARGGSSCRIDNLACSDMKDVSVGAVRYHIAAVERDGQWVAHAARTDTGARFGVECVGASAEEACDRVARWLAWQDEHASALEDLQRAEHAYHRTIAGSAFSSPVEGPSALENAEGVARGARGRTPAPRRDPQPKAGDALTL